MVYNYKPLPIYKLLILTNMKNKKNDIQSRRDFFKKAVKTTLPILGVFISTNIPIIVKGNTMSSMGCDSTCTLACTVTCFGCEGKCTGCTGSCTGVCKGCGNACRETCTIGCQYECQGGCKSTCGNNCSKNTAGW